MTVGFLHRRLGRRADMRDKQRRVNGPCGLTQIVVVPRRANAAVTERSLMRPTIPADTEAVAVGRRCAHARVQALIYQRMRRTENYRFELNRISRIGKQATHDPSPGKS